MIFSASNWVSASVSTIWAITVSAQMDRLVAAEIRRSVRSSGWGRLLFRMVRSTSFSLSFDRLSYYYTEIPSTPQPIFCEQTAPPEGGAVGSSAPAEQILLDVEQLLTQIHIVGVRVLEPLHRVPQGIHLG
ncbi:putative protein conserved in bacteria, partial [Dysosmobacter welbionis]